MISLLLGALLQTAPAAALPIAAPAPEERDKAVGLTSVFIVDACIIRLDSAGSAREYGEGSNTLDREFKAKPEMAGQPVDLDSGPAGDACRVTYHGGHVGELWALFSKPPSICKVASQTDTDIAMSCPATKQNVSADIILHRSSGAQGGMFSETFTWRGPRLP